MDGLSFLNFIFFAMTQMYVITCQCRQLDACVCSNTWRPGTRTPWRFRNNEQPDLEPGSRSTHHRRRQVTHPFHRLELVISPVFCLMFQFIDTGCSMFRVFTGTNSLSTIFSRLAVSNKSAIIEIVKLFFPVDCLAKLKSRCKSYRVYFCLYTISVNHRRIKYPLIPYAFLFQCLSFRSWTSPIILSLKHDQHIVTNFQQLLTLLFNHIHGNDLQLLESLHS
jgi:hypothetical protein